MSAPRRDPIRIVDWDPAWPQRFAEQAAVLQPALRRWLVGPLEHLGSTAVPGLPAKPIIDMLARVRSYADGPSIVAAAGGVGWVAAPEPGDAAVQRWSICYPSVEYRTHHLHVVPADSPDWPTWLAFRDHLRGHPADRDAYARLKRTLAQQDDHDRPAYRAGKAPFITAILQRLPDANSHR